MNDHEITCWVGRLTFTDLSPSHQTPSVLFFSEQQHRTGELSRDLSRDLPLGFPCRSESHCILCWRTGFTVGDENSSVDLLTNPILTGELIAPNVLL